VLGFATSVVKPKLEDKFILPHQRMGEASLRLLISPVMIEREARSECERPKPGAENPPEDWK
jgi:hypothetical protein